MSEKARVSIRRIVCPVCKNEVSENLGAHLKEKHSEDEFEKAVLRSWENGTPEREIGALFNISFKKLERIITKVTGVPLSIRKKPKKIRPWEPKDFKEETTTVWSFQKRGDWATHDARFRGNWSPYIPRNVILKYSKLGEVVLDYFVGGGTTAVEAKLLGRRCIASDINPAAIRITRENLRFIPKQLPVDYLVYEPEVKIGDARDLEKLGIQGEEIDLICAHPPYAGIIGYGSKIEGDLSAMSIDGFLKEMSDVASGSRRVLKPGGKCVILIGDTRKARHEIPIGFKTINVFLNNGFKLKELVIKRQHKCKTTGFWYKKSLQYNFLLLAHEYLPIFEKPSQSVSSLSEKEVSECSSNIGCVTTKPTLGKVDKLESTTVWLFPEKRLEKRLNKNVISRYSNRGKYLTLAFTRNSKDKIPPHRKSKKIDLLFIKSPFLNDAPSRGDIERYLSRMSEIVQQKVVEVNKGGFVVIQTRDVRMDGYIEPLGKRIVDLLTFDNLWLKEIVIVASKNQTEIKEMKNNELEETHQYLLVYEVVK